MGGSVGAPTQRCRRGAGALGVVRGEAGVGGVKTFWGREREEGRG